MNVAQVVSFIRNILQFGGGFVVGAGYLTSAQYTTVSGIVLSAIALIWSLYAHTDVATVTAAGNVDGVTVLAPADLANKSPSKDVVAK